MFELDRFRLNDTTMLIEWTYGYSTREYVGDVYIIAAPADVDESGVLTEDDSPATMIYRSDYDEIEEHLAEVEALPLWDEGPCDHRHASDSDD